MLYLINPKTRRGRVARKRTKRAKRRTPPRGPGGRFKSKKRKVTKRRPAAKRKTTKRRASKRTTKRTTKRRATVARKRTGTRRRRRRTSRGGSIRLTPVRGKIYRKNPAFSVRGITRQLQTGAMNAGAVVLGKAGARVVANFLPLPKDGVMNYVTQVVAALGVGMLSRQFMSAKAAEFVLAGALAAPVETFLKGMPVIGGFLGDDELMMGEYLSAGSMGEYNLPIGEYNLPIGESMGEYVQY